MSPRDERISTMGPDGNPAYRAADPAIAHHRASREFEVVWQGTDTDLPFLEFDPTRRIREMFGQHLAESGAQIGPDDHLISQRTGAAVITDHHKVTLAAATTDRGYLAAWISAGWVPGASTVLARRLTAAK